MTKRRKKSLARQVLAGVMAAGMLWGGFASQAEADPLTGDVKFREASSNGSTEACNNTFEMLPFDACPSDSDKYFAIGYVNPAVEANANGNTLNSEANCSFAAGGASSSYKYSIYGGYVADGSTGNANSNTINIKRGLYNIGGLYGGKSDTGSADGNIVNINGGTFSNDNRIYGGQSNLGSASGNQVNISNGIFNPGMYIYGGYSGDVSGGNNNVVTISGGTFRTGINLYGGTDAGTNNTLNLKMKDLSLDGVWGFQNLNFYIPNTAQANDTMLTVQQPMYLSGATIKAGVQDGSTLKTGDTITLIKVIDAMGIDGYETIKTGTLTDPGYLNYGLDIKATATDVKATIGSASGLSADSKSLAETRAGGIAILNDGATLMAGTSLINAKAAAHAANLSAQGGEGAPAPAGFTPFAAVGANNMRYETGSYVDSKGWGINVGMARELTYKKSVLTFAPVIEYGRSSYDSYLDSGTHGSGKQQFLGVGAVVRQDFAKGAYVEGSLRAGRMKGDYNSGDLNASYDTASNYLGLHLGVGKILKLDKKNKLDIYGKLFYTKQESDDVTLSTGAVYNLESIDSFRTRLGARWTAELAKNSNLYVGLAWDHEFDSNARATYKGFSTPTPSMKGDSGLLELGWQVKPKETSPLSINLNLTGWCGKQKGVQFGAGFEWGF